MSNFNLADIHALVIDMDGVLWRGDTPLPGFQAFFDFLQTRHIPFVLATNNSRKTPDQYMQRLAKFGATVEKETVLTSSLATAAYLKNDLPIGSKAYVVGEIGIREAIQDVGLVVVDDDQAVDVVVAGLDMTLTYEKLKRATIFIRQGARFVGTNGDFTYPTETGLAPGSGSIVKAIEVSSGVVPTIVGKPERLMFDIAVDRLGVERSHIAMLGDRLDTDILGGQNAGLQTILVTSGVNSEADVNIKGIQPDAIFESIDHLTTVWQAL